MWLTHLILAEVPEEVIYNDCSQIPDWNFILVIEEGLVREGKNHYQEHTFYRENGRC